MSQAITPLDAVKKNERYQDLVDTISMRLRFGETKIDFNDYANDLMVGRNFSGLDLDVALNEYRTQGWQIEKVKDYIYQFSAAPVATVTSVAPANNAPVEPLSPEDILQLQSDDVYVDEIVTIINRLLKRSEDNWINLGSVKQEGMMYIYYHPSDVEKALQKFNQIGWQIKVRDNRSGEIFEVSELFKNWEENLRGRENILVFKQSPEDNIFKISLESGSFGAEEAAREVAR